MAKALAWGTLLAVISVAFMTPQVYGPALGHEAGFLSLDFGWEFVLAVVVWHWVCAVHVGLFFNPAPRPRAAS